MLSNTSRLLTYLCAIFYGVLGVLLFLLPEQLAPVFAWKVTAFMTMTIGGWCIGFAWLAYVSARRWSWNLVYASLLNLWIFGVGQLIVLIVFRSKLVLQHPIAWLYVITIIINTITALIGVFDLLRTQPSMTTHGPVLPAIYRALAIGYVLFVGFLSFYGMTAQIGAPGTNGGIFPESMSPFTLRSFSVFYFSLSIVAIPLIWKNELNALLSHGFASYGLITFITSAAFVYIRLFDFTERPGGLAYFGAYLLVAIVFLFIFRKHGTGSNSMQSAKE